MKRLVDYPVYLIVRILVCIVQAISIETGVFCARQLAFLFTYVLPIRRRLVHENLTIAFPGFSKEQRVDLVYHMWEHLFLMIIEIGHVARRIHPTNWRDYIRLVDADKVGRVLHNGRPLIMVTGHFGNFEAGGFFLGMLGYPSYSVARTLDNPYLNDFIKRFREASGQFLVPKNDGYDQILEVLERNDTMTFLADQSAGPKGCWVDFFGKPASTYKAIALLSLQYDAPVVVCYATRRDRLPLHFDVTIAGVLDPRNSPEGISNVKDITQWYTHLLERGIRKCPEQYWWVHRRWKDYKKKKDETKAAREPENA